MKICGLTFGLHEQALASGGRLAWAVEASVAELCDGDFGAPLKLEVWEAIGGRCTLIGAAHTDLRSMLDSKTSSLQLSAQGKVRALKPHPIPLKDVSLI